MSVYSNCCGLLGSFRYCLVATLAVLVFLISFIFTMQQFARTFTQCSRERAFSHAGPAAWNGLPKELRSINDTNIFKSRLITYLFNIAYDNLNSFVMRRWSLAADDSFVCSMV